MYSKLYARRRPRIPSAAEESASVILLPHKKVLPLTPKLGKTLNPVESESRWLNMELSWNGSREEWIWREL